MLRPKNRSRSYDRNFECISDRRTFNLALRNLVYTDKVSDRNIRSKNGHHLYNTIPEGFGIYAGASMETTDSELKLICEEMEDTSETLKQLSLEVADSFEEISPKLKSMIDEIRSLRSSLTSELNMALAGMREVRKFFLGSDHNKEMDRLERFIKLNREILDLTKDGTMEAVSDIISKLAAANESKEVSNEGKSP